jgi:acyl-CoA oxidase
LQRALIVVQEADDVNNRNVLLRLFSLYGLWSLEKFLSTLYEGGYAQGPQATHLIHEGILKLCSDIKDDAVALIDVIAPPDFILNSVLGASDGEVSQTSDYVSRFDSKSCSNAFQVYKHLQSAMFRSPYAMSRPSWWQDIVNWKANVQNKL